MSARLVQAVMASGIKPLGVRFVALVLAWHASDDGQAWPSNNTLASECGITRDRVRHCLKALRAAGVVEVALKGAGGARTGTTRYRFADEWVKQWTTGVRTNQGSSKPGIQEAAEGGSYEPRGGFVRTPNNNERKNPSGSSLSLKTRGAVSPAGSRARGARPAVEPTAKDYSLEGLTQ